MIVDCVLTNAKAYLKQGIADCSIAIEDGKIFKINKETQMPSADEKIDLHNQLVLPGVIDLHVHLRDENCAYKETFLTGTAAAAAGGVTTVLDMPNNSPVTMSAAALQNRMQLATKRIHVNVGFYSEFPTDLNEIKKIVEAGAVGFKLYLAEQVGGLTVDDDEVVKEAFKKISELNVPVAVHAEDHQMLKKAVEELKLAKRDNLTAFLKAHNELVESTSINRLLKITAQIEKMQLHFCHLSTETGLKAISEAKKSGKPVTCEATPHHLLLSKADYDYLGTQALTVPPLRTKENVEAICKGVIENTIDTIGSDHAPHTVEEKESRNVWEIKGGIPGLETTLPLLLTMVHKKQLLLSRVVQLLSERPAAIFGLKDRGALDPGKNADLVVVDFNAKFKIDATKFRSKAKYSPFNGWDVQGKPVKTFVNGQLVMEEHEVASKAGRVVVARGEQT